MNKGKEMIHHVALKPPAKTINEVKKPTDPCEPLAPTSRSPVLHPLQDLGRLEDTRATMDVQDDEASSPAIASEALELRSSMMCSRSLGRARTRNSILLRP